MPRVLSEDAQNHFNDVVRDAYAAVIQDLSGEDAASRLTDAVRDAALTAILDLANVGQTDIERLRQYGRSRAEIVMYEVPRNGS